MQEAGLQKCHGRVCSIRESLRGMSERHRFSRRSIRRGDGLTARQSELFESIQKFIGDRGYSPTIRELATLAGGVSLSTIHKRIRQLVRIGKIRTPPNHRRGIEIVSPECQTCVHLEAELKTALAANQRLSDRIQALLTSAERT